MWIIDLKENSPPVDIALAKFEIELERAIYSKEVAVKVLHGYGSHGKGGIILNEVRTLLAKMKKQRKIKDYFFGDKWNVFENQKLISKDKNLADDEDLNKNNPGITIVVLN